MQEAVARVDNFYDVHYMAFRRKVKLLTGLDLDDYRGEQLTRRLGVIMARSGASNLTEYARMLECDDQRLKQFSNYLTINVSEFFRDPDRFAFLRESVLPSLLGQSRSLNIWSAGCSNGAEPYSIAILLEELAPRSTRRFLATDIDERIIGVARAGRDYRPADVKNVPPLLLKRHFVTSGDRFAVKDTIRRYPTFAKHNLLADPFDSGFDLICCRNVVIYFTAEAKASLFASLAQSLRRGGVLFVGATEIIQGANQLGLECIRPSYYRRVN